MSDLLMDLSTNDLKIVNGDLAIVEGSDAIVQDLQQQLQLWFGEYFLDTTKGIPFRQQILVKNPNIDIVQGYITDCVTKVPGILQMLDFAINYDANGRAATVSVSVQESSGQVINTTVNVGLPTNGAIQGTTF